MRAKIVPIAKKSSGTLGRTRQTDASAFSVRCERDGRDIELEVCVACLEFRELVITPSGAPAHIRCQPPPAPSGNRALPVCGPAATTCVRRLMTSPAPMMHDDASADALRSFMVEHAIGAVAVVDADRRPLGVVSARDVLRGDADDAFAPDEEHEMESSHRHAGAPDPVTAARVRDLVRRTAVVVHQDAMLAAASALMVRERVGRLPVVGPDGRVVGILSAMDVVEWLARSEGHDVTPTARRAR